MASLDEKVKSRAGFKANVTKRSNILRKALKEGLPYDDVKKLIDDVTQSWEKFENAHDAVHCLYIEDDDIENSYMYFDREEKKYRELLEKATKVQSPVVSDSVAASTGNSDSDLAAMVKSLKRMALPQQELPIFGGDPIEYCYFVKAFENIIERKTDCSSQRLYYLMQYTRGEVKELVRSCMEQPPDIGYSEAKRLLKEHYGNNYIIASVLVDNLIEGPVIKSEDGQALHNYSMKLISCKNTLGEIGYLSKVENPDNLRRIIARLPYDLRKKWRVKADYITTFNDREIRLDDISNFVQSEARVLNHPVFGKLSDGYKISDLSGQSSLSKGGCRKPNNPVGQLGQRNFAISSYNQCMNRNQNQRVNLDTIRTPSSTVCQLCSVSNHSLSNCYKFRGYSYDQRVKVLKQKRLCFLCLGQNHIAQQCQSREFCEVCHSRHNTLLHRYTLSPNVVNSSSVPCSNRLTEGMIHHDNRNSPQPSTATGNVTENGQSLSATNQCVKQNITRRIGLPIVPVKIKGCGGFEFITYALLDTGSTSTFCNENLIKDLGFIYSDLRQTNLSLSTLTEADNLTQSYVTDLKVSDLDGTYSTELTNVFSRPSLPMSEKDIPRQSDLNGYSYLSGVVLADVNAYVGLIVGNDNHHVLEPLEVISSTNGGPHAVKTIFGWAVNGPLGGSTCVTNKMAFSINRNEDRRDSELTRQFQLYCDLEFNDRISDDTKCMSQEDKRALEIMESSVTLTDDKHYQIDLPFRDEQINMPNNRALALHRLKSLKKRFLSDPMLLKEYADFLDNMIKSGFCEKVPTIDLDRDDGMVWYLPHHNVYHPTKKKIRVVFNCSSKYLEFSLNDHLLQGPDLTNSLLGVLTRFRQERIAFIADIEGMFHQVRVTPSLCDALRFLWWTNRNLDANPDEYRMRVHLFGATSSPSCSSFALRRCALDNTELFDATVTDTVLRNFYVDDCLKSVGTVHDAVRLLSQLIEILDKGGFRLTQISSNSRQVLESVPETERAKTIKDLDFNIEQLPMERTLGVLWDMESDSLLVRVKIDHSKPKTRRGILSTVSSLYVPIGFTSPISLPVKSLLQEMCRIKLGWDDIIPAWCDEFWLKWLNELPSLEGLRIGRCFKPSGFDDPISAQLHHFSDAAEIGYGAVSFLRLFDGTTVHCSFVLGKSRVTPLKTVSIPRLELAAAVLSTRLDGMILKEIDIPIETSYFWTDSTAVLKYIRNEDKRFQVYVANRVSAIREHSKPCQWRFIDGCLNPADDASRGLKPTELIISSRWLMGPEFLWRDESQWPKQPDDVNFDIDPSDQELRKTVNTVEVDEDHLLNSFSQFSSWYKLKKCVAWILRLKSRLLSRVRKIDSVVKSNRITVSELRRAENAILGYVQKRYYPDECSHSLKRTSSLIPLDPVLVDGLLCVGGRLRRSTLPDKRKHPIIVPKKSHLCTLIIDYYHRVYAHRGCEYVLSNIRKKYWLINAKSAIRRRLNACITCRKQRAKAVGQKMSDLPEDRVTPNLPPFTNVGIDCFGPFLVKRGRAQVKRYGCLFTCLTCRAIHIEVCHSLSTDSFICALRRFICRRGNPLRIRSDNGTNFVGGQRELKKAVSEWNQDQIHEFLLQREIEWVFNPPTA
ncbi:uncharacterized protein LOC141904651 [Tubulanus polymorphus]|uniref:uncharacterized protein LOC141904651 n=1 Tax=Tubulanus polymorphus TaxID=672921 RepID=UPI003DA2CDD3